MESELVEHFELQTRKEEEIKSNDAASNEIYATDESFQDIDIDNPKTKMMNSLNSDAVRKQTDGSRNKRLIWLLIQYFLCCINKKKAYEETMQITQSSKIYTRHTQIRLFYIWVFAILMIVFSNAERLKFSDKADTMGVFGMISFICILICLVSFCVARTNPAKSLWTSFCEAINDVFSIPYSSSKHNQDADNLFDLDRTKWGVLYLIVIGLSCLNNILVFGLYYLTHDERKECDNDVIRLSKGAEFAGKCVIHKSSVSHAYVFVGALIITFPSYYRVNRKYVKALNEYLTDNGKDNNLTPKIVELRKNIQHKLRTQWKSSKLFTNRIFERVIIFMFCFAFHFGTYGIMRNDIHHPKFIHLKPGHIVFCLWLYFVDSAILTIGVSIIIEIVIHYGFPSFILDLLSQQFKADSIQDIICWWQLRKYYLECVIDIYGSGITECIRLSLVGSVILLVFAFTWSYDDAVNEDTVLVVEIFLGFSILPILWTLALTRSAVEVYTKQLSHVHTLNKEKLRLEYLSMIKTDKYQAVYDNILVDVKHNVKPIKVFSIKMVPEFLIFLKTTAVTVAIAAFRLFF